jgi:lipopolysaccharide export system permease protein
MNKLVFQKILSDYLLFFLISLLSSSLIVWIFQAVNYLDLMVEDGKGYLTYINYSLLNFPKIISRLLPFVLFFSFFFILNNYEKTNELLIFWNFGINKIHLIYFFFNISLSLMIFQLFLTSYVVPNSLKYSKELMNNSNLNFFEGFIKPKKFNDTIKGVTIYSEDKNDNGDLSNIFVKKNVGKNSFQITHAKTGKLKVGYNNILELYDGETINSINNKITKFKFLKSDFSLNNAESNAVQYIKLQETPTQVILSCVNKIFKINIKFLNNVETKRYALGCNINSLDNIFRELYKRFIIPLYIPILILLTSLLLTSSKEEKKYFKLKIGVFLINFLIIIFSETSIKLISNNFFKNLSLVITPIILIFIIIFCFAYNLKLKFSKT